MPAHSSVETFSPASPRPSPGGFPPRPVSASTTAATAGAAVARGDEELDPSARRHGVLSAVIRPGPVADASRRTIPEVESGQRRRFAASFAILIAVALLGPGFFAWTIQERYASLRRQMAGMHDQVEAIDRDLDRLVAVLATTLEPLPPRGARGSDQRKGAAAPLLPATPSPPSAGPATANRLAPVPFAGWVARLPEPVEGRPLPADPADPEQWAEIFGSELLLGRLGPADRVWLWAEWRAMAPALQRHVLRELQRRYQLDANTFLEAMRASEATGAQP